MERKLLLTQDGSSTIQMVGSGDTYHSKYGAVQESRHVFLAAGLKEFLLRNPGRSSLRVFEVGFGTGLNALLTAVFAEQDKIDIVYQTVEAYPLIVEEYEGLNYGAQLGADTLLKQMHEAGWGVPYDISAHFLFKKYHNTLQDVLPDDNVDVIYFDAFAPGSQPELWTVDIFSKMYRLLADGGILATYCSKVIVQKAMKEAGFRIEKLKGPPGKREIIRGVK